MTKQLNIGLFGFGNVGKGLYTLLQRVPSSNVRITKICVRDASKPRDAEATLFTDNADDIFNDPGINFIVELIDDAEASFSIVSRALLTHRPVVTGNKKMLARHLPELIALQEAENTALLYLSLIHI